MKRQIEIQLVMENAAFDDYANDEVVRILRELADRISSIGLRGASVAPLKDYNGNSVGHFSYFGGTHESE